MRPYGEVTGKIDPRLATHEAPAGRTRQRRGSGHRTIDNEQIKTIKRAQKRAERRRAKREIDRDRP